MKIPEEIVHKHNAKKTNEKESILFYVDNATFSSKLLDFIPKYFMKLNNYLIKLIM